MLLFLVTMSCPTFCDPMHCNMPAFLVLRYLPEFVQTHVHWVDNTTQPSHPLSPPSPHTLILSQDRVFFNELAVCIRWPKFWSFSISPCNEYSGLISFTVDWLDFLAVHEILKSLLQHHNSKASILWCSAFFIAQLSHPYMTTGKTIALSCQQSDVSAF